MPPEAKTSDHRVNQRVYREAVVVRGTVNQCRQLEGEDHPSDRSNSRTQREGKQLGGVHVDPQSRRRPLAAAHREQTSSECAPPDLRHEQREEQEDDHGERRVSRRIDRRIETVPEYSQGTDAVAEDADQAAVVEDHLLQGNRESQGEDGQTDSAASQRGYADHDTGRERDHDRHDDREQQGQMERRHQSARHEGPDAGQGELAQ